MSQKIVDQLIRDGREDVHYGIADSGIRLRLTATASSPAGITRELVRRMMEVANENDLVATQTETDGGRIRMELAPGTLRRSRVDRIARDDRTMLVVLTKSDAVHRVPLCGVGDRDDMLLTKPGDVVTVLLRSCNGNLHACGMINNTMRDDI